MQRHNAEHYDKPKTLGKAIATASTNVKAPKASKRTAKT